MIFFLWKVYKQTTSFNCTGYIFDIQFYCLQNRTTDGINNRYEHVRKGIPCQSKLSHRKVLKRRLKKLSECFTKKNSHGNPLQTSVNMLLTRTFPFRNVYKHSRFLFST